MYSVKSLYYVFHLPMLLVSCILVMLWVLQSRMHLSDGKHSIINCCLNYMELKWYCLSEGY